MIRRFLRTPALLLFVCAAASCHTPSALFQPSEPNVAATIDRVPGAVFDLADKDGTRRGEFRVWCVGAEQVKVGEGRRTRIDMGLSIENTSKDELRFAVADARLRSVRVAKRVLDSLSPREPEATLRVPPDSVRQAYLTFDLPDGIAPREVSGFQFRWEVEGPHTNFSDFTAFVRWQRRRRSAYYGGWPYWGWGPGWGFGFGAGTWCW